MKWILLCEEYPIRMSLLVARVQDFKQKSEANSIVEKRKGSNMFKFLDEENKPCEELDPGLSINEVYYEHVEPFLFTQANVKRYLMQDADAEQFAILVSTPIPTEVIEEMKLYSPEAKLPDEAIHDITVRDLTGEDPTREDPTGKRTPFSLLDFALNLSPSHRDAIAMDNVQVITEYEPRRVTMQPGTLLSRAKTSSEASIRENTIRRKDEHLTKPKALA